MARKITKKEKQKTREQERVLRILKSSMKNVRSNEEILERLSIITGKPWSIIDDKKEVNK